MGRAFVISFVAHILLLSVLWLSGFRDRAELFINLPQVHRVQLISMPTIMAAPPEEPIPEVEVESIPPPPEEKKKLKPKKKKAQPKPKVTPEKTQRRIVAKDQISGPRLDEMFEFPWYLRLMQNKISRNWRNPYGGELEVVVATIYFRIERNGSVSSSRVEKSSGFPAFDRAALRAVINSNPLPQLPPDFGESRLTVHLDFEYRKK